MCFETRPNIPVWVANYLSRPFLVPLPHASRTLDLLERVAERSMANIVKERREDGNL